MSNVYQEAGRARQLVGDGRSSAKGAVFAVKPANIRHVYAIVGACVYDLCPAWGSLHGRPSPSLQSRLPSTSPTSRR